MMLRLGYNTSGFARSNNLMNIVELIHDFGYKGMELTLDRRHFHPYFSEKTFQHQLSRQISAYDLGLVLNTGGRYVLSEISHEPSLVSDSAPERKKFVQFVVETIRIAPALGARIIMLHSGALPSSVDPEAAWEWMIDELIYLAETASNHGVTLGFEFHPSMLVATLADYRNLKMRVNSPALKLTLDVGHVICTETRPLSQVITECNGEIVNVHLEDIKDRKHVHLPIGNGDIDFADVFRGLEAINYTGLINAEFNTDDLEVNECELARNTIKYLSRLM